MRFSRSKCSSISMTAIGISIVIFTLTCGAMLGVYTYTESNQFENDNSGSQASSLDQLRGGGGASSSTYSTRDERFELSESGDSELIQGGSHREREVEQNGESTSYDTSHRMSRRDLARALSLRFVLSELRRRQSRSWRNGPNSTEVDSAQEPEQEDSEYLPVSSYLTDVDEEPQDVRDIPDIMEDPSNIIGDESSVSLLAWDVRQQEPQGSYLYVLQQDLENHISQVHRYFCRERRLDILVETCQPVASVYSDSGVPMAVGYTEEGLPLTLEADGLDESLFSRSSSYVEANEYLFYLQEYLDSIRA